MSEKIHPERIRVDTYGTDNPPDAAKFGVGAGSLADIQKATEARRELSNAQSAATTVPVRRDK